ncbi:thymidylate kinase [Atheta coriaria]|uniref:thymidylate kinase n=1 Tax=Dalotia coriaria TaxID=877792 RepID=UPI0031F36EF8
MSLKRGALIVLEGVDRSGKSTQCRKLVESLKRKNQSAELFVYPDRSTLTGQLISKYLSDKDCKLHDKAIHLLFSANRWENADKMTKMLHDGVTLIVDRYSYSGIAYSSIKPGMDLEWCKTQEIGLPKPDAVFLLTLNEVEMNNRPGFGDERYEKESIQKQVLDVFHQLLDASWETVDASGSIDDVHDKLMRRILNVIDKVGSKKLQTLKFKEQNIENSPIIANGTH